MIKNIALIFLLIGSGLLISCKNDTTNVGPTYTVKGNLTQNNLPLAKATVVIDDKLSSSILTDSNGYYEIRSVPKGTHKISYSKTSDDGSFVQRSSSIDVNSDLNLTVFRLPKPVVMMVPDSILSNSMKLIWNSSDAEDFREYKVYRSIGPGLDENTGTLAFVATSLKDTMFTDTGIDIFTKYYYRVYVMNEFGKLGGSNIVNATTINTNILVNGSFEFAKNDSIPTGWYYDPDFAKVKKTLISKSGNYAIYVRLPHPRTNIGPIGEVGQQIFASKFSQGKIYTLSFWVLVDTASSDGSLNVDLEYSHGSGNYLVHSGNTIAKLKTADWVQYSYDFTAPATTEDYFVDFLVWSTKLPYSFWIDDVQLRRKE